MTNDLAIQVKEVGKKYCRSLRRSLVYGVRDVARDIFGMASPSGELRRDEFWALKDVSFEVKRGECLGLIGANGAGKSTLLKLLNGVILPDTGTIRVHGRVGGLLELGAGFHPMLTGRENIHLTGAILGLKKEDVEEKFDDIVDFADLWDFIDTPVKYYSSGMYVRLGFSLAISIDPDILIVDESMAVGDAEFKKRCLNRIQSFIEAGKTIILVSHNLQDIDRIARRAILLRHGAIHADGLPYDVIGSYFNLIGSRPAQARREARGSNGKRRVAIIEIAEIDLCDRAGRQQYYFRTHDELQVRIKVVAHQPIVNPVFRVQIYRDDGVFCHGMNTERHGISIGQIDAIGTITLRYTDLRLLRGDYKVRVSILMSQDDEFPLHESVASQEMRVESKMTDGGGIFSMPTEWILGRCHDNRDVQST